MRTHIDASDLSTGRAMKSSSRLCKMRYAFSSHHAVRRSIGLVLAAMLSLATLTCSLQSQSSKGENSRNAGAGSESNLSNLDAPPFGLTIPKDHPRLWWNAERIAQARKSKAAKSFRAKDDDYLGQAFEYVITGSAGKCRPAIQWALAFKPGDLNTTASDELRWHAEKALLVYDWCFDQLAPGQRNAFVANWNGWLEKEMAKEWGGVGFDENNYFWGNLRNELMWGIASYYENPAADKFLADALVKRWKGSFGRHAANFGKGGVPQEGTGYGTYTLNYPIIPFVSAGLLGRDLYNETDWFQGAVYYQIYSTTPSATTNSRSGSTGWELFPFNDDQFFVNGGSASRNADFMAAAANHWSGSAVGKHAREWLKMISASASAFIAATDRGGEPESFASLPLDYYAPGPQYFFGRSAWGPAGTTFALQLGVARGVGHHHLDYGNWMLWRGGRWLSRETTGYSDTIKGYGGNGQAGAADTVAHNCILVNGAGVSTSDWFDTQGPPRMRRLESRPEYAYANVDLTPIYHTTDAGHPERDNPGAAHVEREFLFIRALETMVIFDRVAANAVPNIPAASATKTFLAHSESKPRVEDAQHVTFTNGNQALRLTTLVPSNPLYRVVEESSAPIGQFRLEVTTSGTAQSYFLHVLQARGARDSDLNASVSDDGASYTVTLADAKRGTATIIFKQGRSSSGGSVILNGRAHPLANGVQKLTVTASGPVWEPIQ